VGVRQGARLGLGHGFYSRGQTHGGHAAGGDGHARMSANGQLGGSIMKASRVGSSAPDNEKKDAQSLPNCDDDCASLKVFDTFSGKERARRKKPIIELVSANGALQAYGVGYDFRDLSVRERIGVLRAW
jgi:hypothetical protein